MESISENQELIQKFMDLLEPHLGESCEVILHD